MKKLLLYLMTLLVFGAVPVDSFAKKYLVIPCEGNGWSIAESNRVEIPEASGIAIMKDVPIGDGAFAVGVYDTDVDPEVIYWYTASTAKNKLTAGKPTTWQRSIGDAMAPSAWTSANKATYAVWTVIGGEAGARYDVTVNTDRSTVTADIDYSTYTVKYKVGSSSETTIALSKSSGANFQIKTGANDTSMNLWFVAPGNHYYCLGDGTGLNYANFDNGSDYSDVTSITSAELASDATKISGLDKNTTYLVHVNYVDAGITIEKVPTTLYCSGEIDGEALWNANSKVDKRKFATNIESYNFTIDGVEVSGTDALVFDSSWKIANKGWFVIYDGSKRYRPNTNINSGNLNQWMALTGYNDNISTQLNASLDKLRIKVILNEAGEPAYVWFEEGASNTDYPNYAMITHYGGNQFHATTNISQDGDYYIATDNGQSFTDPAEGVSYDGLRLGYDPFCIETVSPDGTSKFWGMESSNDGLVPGESYVFKRFNTEAEAKANTKMAENSNITNYQNSRYDIIWNFNTHTATIKLNDVWTSAPNQMYLVRLTQDQVSSLLPTTDLSDYIKGKTEEDGVYILSPTSDGVYDAMFSKDDREDLPKGSYMVLVGRMGRVYNINTQTGDSFELGKDWDGAVDSYQVILSTSDSQSPALISTDRLSNTDFLVRVYANYSDQTFQNSYVLTFSDYSNLPDKFIIEYYKVHDDGSDSHDSSKDIEIPRIGKTDKYSLENVKFERGQKYKIYAVKGTERTQCGPDYGTNTQYKTYDVYSEFISTLLSTSATGSTPTPTPSGTVTITGDYNIAYSGDKENIHYWGGSSESKFPGVKMATVTGSDGNTYKVFKVPEGTTRVLFNTNGNDNKTGDMDYSGSKILNDNGATSTEVKFVSANNVTITGDYNIAYSGTKEYIHYWGGTSSSNFPGEKMTKVTGSDGLNYYVFKVPAGTTHVIFNNGSNQNQTGDLAYSSDKVYGDSGATEKSVIFTTESGSGSGSGSGSTETPTVSNGATFPNDGRFYIGSNEDTKNLANTTVTILWNNGSPLFTAFPTVPDAAENKVRVYFIDYEGWGNIQCYNYSDIGLTPNNDGSWDQVSASSQNSGFPGVPMKLIYGAHDLKTELGIPAIDNNKLYFIDLEASLLETGNYNRPKIIFAKKDKEENGKYKQTGNLYLIKGGVYQNNYGSVSEQTEYIPESYYSYWKDQTAQSARLEECTDVPFSTIYTDDPALVAYLKNGGKLLVDVTYDRNGNGKMDYYATGIPGTTYMYLQTINGKDYARISIANYIVPENTLANISFWPSEIYRRWNGKDNKWETNNSQMNFEDRVYNNLGQYDNSCVISDKHNDNYDGQTFTFKGVDYTGDHFGCYNSLCSLNFYGANFSDGNVYRRHVTENGTQEPIVKLSTLTKPDAIYIVPTNTEGVEGKTWKKALEQYKAFAVNEAESTPTKTTYVYNITNPVTSKSVEAFKLNLIDKTLPEKMIYLIPEVSSSAAFYVIAQYGDYFSSLSGETDINMVPNRDYSMLPDKSNKYTINSAVSSPESYTIKVKWADQAVFVVPNLRTANFQFAMMNEDGELVTQLTSALMIPAHSDDCLSTDNVTKDPNHLTKIYFKYADGFDDDLSRFNDVNVYWTRDTEYNKYFNNDVNKQAHLVPRRDTDLEDDEIAVLPQAGETAVNKYIVKPDDANGYAYVYVHGHTASTGFLTIEFTKQTDLSFEPSKVTIPVRIFPTIEGVGVVINDQPVKKNDDNRTYSVRVPQGPHMDGDVNFGSRLQFECNSALHAMNGQTLVRYFWDQDPEVKPTPDQPSPVRLRSEGTILKNPNASQLIDNVDEEQFDNTDIEGNAHDLSEFSIHKAPSVQDGNNRNVYLQIEQNGMKSPVYTVNVNKNLTQDEIITEVEEILGVDEEVAPVYYNLNGVRVDAERLEPGIYVKVTGNTSEKVYVK